MTRGPEQQGDRPLPRGPGQEEEGVTGVPVSAGSGRPPAADSEMFWEEVPSATGMRCRTESATGRAAEDRRQDAEPVLGKATLILPRQRSACCLPPRLPPALGPAPLWLGRGHGCPRAWGGTVQGSSSAPFPRQTARAGSWSLLLSLTSPGWVLLQDSVSYPESRRHSL